MARTNHLLVLARLETERQRKLAVIASAAQLDLSAMADTAAALTWLERHEPEVVAFDSSIPKAEQLCQKLRGRKTWSRVPLIALTEEVSDARVEKLYSMGVDDVVPLSAWPAFISRLRGLPRVESIHPPPARGKAIVADPERARCDVVGRVLMNAGFDVRYALDRRALEYYSLQTEVNLIVVNVELGNARELIEEARKHKSNAAWVVATRRRDMEEQARALADLRGIALVPAIGAPESVLFVANELLSNRRTARQSARVLHGALVAFRPAGMDTDELGFTYNVSSEGLYVRTLAPPEGEETWLEVTPPRHNRRVRLLGRVVWRRGFEGNTGAAVPPGFGVQLVDALGQGLDIWRESYLSLDGASAEAPKPKSTPPPKPASYRPPPGGRLAPTEESVEPEPQITAIAPRLASEPKIPRVSAPEIELGPPVSMDVGRPSAPAPLPPPPSPPAVARPAPVPPPMPASEPAPEVPMQSGSRVGLILLLMIVAAGAAVFVAWQRGIIKFPHAAHTAASATKPKPAPTHSAAPASASAKPAPPPKPTADLSALAPTEGYLYVKIPLEAKVFINGRAVGPTNQPVKTGCGMRFVRVGEGGGHWLSDGHSVKIECGKLTKAEFTPSPPAPAPK